MQAIVTANALNVRSLPSTTGRVLGVLLEGTVVNTLGKTDGWYEIKYKDSVGFVYGGYLDDVSPAQPLRGIVSASILNVRDAPSISGNKLGTVRRGSLLNIRSRHADWAEIEFNNDTAYVSIKYVELLTPLPGYTAMVNTDLLNIRSEPTRSAPILGQVTEGTPLKIDSVYGTWGQFMFGGSRGYVLTKYVRKISDMEEDESPPMQEEESEIPPITQVEAGEEATVIEPLIKLPIKGGSTQRKVAKTWNNYGAFLDKLSSDRDIDVACSVAVLCVESSGKGFEQNNQDRMIIRFENHKFWKYWGKKNPAAFREHFKYSSQKVWTGHKWRPSADQEWRAFHGNQAKEWQVFSFARDIDADAAMLSISMGAPQIMGFHYERLGYQSVEEMFDSFSSDIRAQINGLFDFFSSSMIVKLSDLDFVGFAKGYNGDGQKEKYGSWIQSHYNAFKQLHG
jgi:uncharacterized protein YgiM (DUF1202 family)